MNLILLFSLDITFNLNTHNKCYVKMSICEMIYYLSLHSSVLSLSVKMQKSDANRWYVFTYKLKRFDYSSFIRGRAFT